MTDFERFAGDFERQSGRQDGPAVTTGLNTGLELLSSLLYARLHEDVERTVGEDSMLMPPSELKSRLRTMTEISLYQVAESATAARQWGYLPAGAEWYIPWLAGLRLGQSPLEPAQQQRIDGYLAKTSQARRLALTDVLVSVLPESRRAPLVLFLLFPLAVQIVTAKAFGDDAGAKRLRGLQIDLLPIITGCHQCRGNVLDLGQTCPLCSNPLWKTELLNAVE